MSLTVIVILILIPPLITASAFCSASETALFGLTYNDRLQLRRLRPKAGAAAEALLASPRALLVTILISNMSVNALIFALSSLLVIQFENAALGAAINTTAVILLIIFGEVLPKLLAGAGRVSFCRYLAPSVLIVFRILTPIRTIVEFGVIGPLSRLFRPSDAPASSAAPVAGQLDIKDIESLLELGTVQGTIDRDEQSLIAQVVQIGHRRVWDVMTPRTDIRWVDFAAPPDAVVAAIRESNHRYLPVYIRSPDNQVAGMLDARRYVAAWAAGSLASPGDRSVDRFIFPITYVPENARLDQLLEHFRSTSSEIALCVDEHGTIDGLVSLSDIASRFVDEFSAGDAADSAGELEAVGVVAAGPGQWSVPGRLSVHDFADLFNLDADPHASTVAGLITRALGRIPTPGDAVSLDSLHLRVESMRGNMILRVLVSFPHLSQTPRPPKGGAA